MHALASDIAGRAEPADDAAARREARELVALLGAGAWLQPIFDLDLRACCLMREALAEASPLADAVFALQGLGTTPICSRGPQAQKDRWLGPIAEGKVMTAFAMTEPEAGSDVAAIATTARRDGPGYVLDGAKTLISNAGIADLYAVFASTDRAQGSQGNQLLPGARGCVRAALRRAAGAERAAPAGRDRLRGLPGSRGMRCSARRGAATVSVSRPWTGYGPRWPRRPAAWPLVRSGSRWPT